MSNEVANGYKAGDELPNPYSPMHYDVQLAIDCEFWEGG